MCYLIGICSFYGSDKPLKAGVSEVPAVLVLVLNFESFSCDFLASVGLFNKNGCTKGGFFSESAIRFSDIQISKKIFQKTILSLKFKFQAQDSFLEYFFLRFGDLKKFHRTF